MGFVQFNGPPGATWTNDTGKVKYQFVANLRNTCGVCLQYHLAIGNSWPIPFHFGCACRQKAIYPGGESQEFVDFREVLRDLPPDQKAAAVGANNWRLIRSGKVKWEDVVTEGRVRSLSEVVSLKRLSLETLGDAGIPKAIAEKAHKAGNTAAHTLADEARKRLVAALEAKGVTRDQAKRSVAERLASRVRIGEGPSGPQGTLVKLSPPPGLPPLPVAEIARAIEKTGKTLDVPKATKAVAPKPPQALDLGSDATKAQARAEDLSKPWRDALTDAEREAVEVYKSNAYRQINATLRGTYEPIDAAKMESRVRAIDSAIAKGSVPEAVYAYRGVNDAAAIGLDATNPAALVGSEVADKAYTSVSLAMSGALDFALESEGEGAASAILKILVPQGAKAGFPEGMGVYQEAEVVLPRGSRFRVLDVGGPETMGARRRKVYTVTLELIP